MFYKILIWTFLILGQASLAHELKQGDILLIELNCVSCLYIASETDSRFSHSGLLMQNPQGEWVVLESLSMVDHISLSTFLRRSRAGASVAVMRSFDYQILQDQGMKKRMWEDYLHRWRGLPFDHEFLWDNQTSRGLELLYCSEFIHKFMKNYLTHAPGAPEPMDYQRHYSFWLRYFQGGPPQGKLGNNPASFERDPHWFMAFEIEHD